MKGLLSLSLSLSQLVWLPSLGAWAQVQEPAVADFAASSCQGSESRADSARAASCSSGEWNLIGTCEHNPRLRRCHHKSCKEHEHCPRLRDHHEASDEHDEHEHHGDCHGSYHYDEHHDHHHEPHHTCPICLSPITQSSLTVLRWCMHQFCITCIEKWSGMQRFCPLCKQIFYGWYYNIESPSVFSKKDLAIESSSQTSGQLRTRGRYPAPRQPTSLSLRRSTPLPWRRDFRFVRTTSLARFEKMLESKCDDDALQWRASVYKRNLRAIPPHVNSRIKIKQAPASDPERKARIERRLEPFIH